MRENARESHSFGRETDRDPVGNAWKSCGEASWPPWDGEGYCFSVHNWGGFLDSSESVQNLSLLFRTNGDRVNRSPDLFW